MFADFFAISRSRGRGRRSIVNHTDLRHEQQRDEDERLLRILEAAQASSHSGSSATPILPKSISKDSIPKGPSTASFESERLRILQQKQKMDAKSAQFADKQDTSKPIDGGVVELPGLALGEVEEGGATSGALSDVRDVVVEVKGEDKGSWR